MIFIFFVKHCANVQENNSLVKVRGTYALTFDMDKGLYILPL